MSNPPFSDGGFSVYGVVIKRLLYFRLRICIFKMSVNAKSHRQDKPIDITIAFTLPVASHLRLD